ncbi:MAG: hypothetical protein E7321_08905 [Clostridiales bacterium]|nr:hypothetical protein [Clostridiales bacterium]
MALVDNKAKIQALIAGINALPEAGSGEAPDLVLQEKSVTPTKEMQSVTPDTGFDGLSKVSVNAIPDEYIVPSGTVNITQNGTHNVKEAESVNVNVPAPEFKTQKKTATPGTSEQTIKPDSGYDGLSQVTVEAIPSKYQDVTTPLAELNAVNGGTAASTMQGAVDNTETLASSQATLISQIASALEGKATGGGGTSIETCTLTLEGEYLTDVACTRLVDGETVYENLYTENGFMTIENLVCKSIILVSFETNKEFYASGESISGIHIYTDEEMKNVFFRVNLGNGDIGSVTFTFH